MKNNKNIKIKQYIKKIIQLYPSIVHGRVKHQYFEERVLKNINLIKKYFKL